MWGTRDAFLLGGLFLERVYVVTGLQ